MCNTLEWRNKFPQITDISRCWIYLMPFPCITNGEQTTVLLHWQSWPIRGKHKD